MTKRKWYGLSIFILSILLWFTRSDTLKLVVREREVLFNRYSEGHFAVLFIVTLLLWVIVACLWSKRPLNRQLLGDALTGIVMTVITVLLSVYLTHWMTKPRYIETTVETRIETGAPETVDQKTATQKTTEAAGKATEAAIVRHRPPNTVDKFTWEDKPEMVRSYPNPPKGYGVISGTLTTDSKGFRNTGEPRDSYDIVVVGDSFAAGSHVSDEQVWTVLLEKQLGKSIYNLGVSGSAPITYLSNYQLFGTSLKPAVTVFVIYEGNDFKADGIPEHLLASASPQHRSLVEADTKPGTEQTTSTASPALAESASPTMKQRWEDFSEHLSNAFKASPITKGLKVVSRKYFETAFADNELRKYSRIKDVMPMKVTQNGITHYYAFDPKRLAYLFHSEDKFRRSKEWKATAKILDAMVQTAVNNGSKPIFVYVPSTPHLVIPFASDLPAKQISRFLAYAEKNLPDTHEKTKQAIYENLNSLENVFMKNCAEKQLQCLSLTPVLQQAVQQGIQPYYSYDQHWTPDGNKIAAEAVENYLRSITP